MLIGGDINIGSTGVFHVERRVSPVSGEL